ncbi:MAG TPA: response regulator [Thermosynechococcus sp. M98_K2018_005]|nr:response regulator [Thermosynechococcus sp. M98_K2018_005]HIK47644.1 response regulator [Thermosynechococcus sp. M55_K2018_012]
MNPIYRQTLACVCPVSVSFEVLFRHSEEDSLQNHQIGGSKNTKNYPPHLILLDLNLPGMEGYDICRQLRRSPQREGVPIVMLTAKDDPVHRIRARTESPSPSGLAGGAIRKHQGGDRSLSRSTVAGTSRLSPRVVTQILRKSLHHSILDLNRISRYANCGRAA